MTMLDRMRRHKNWLKWSLFLVCVAFVIFYIPDFLKTEADAASSATVAKVEGRDITAGDFQRIRRCGSGADDSHSGTFEGGHRPACPDSRRWIDDRGEGLNSEHAEIRDRERTVVEVLRS